MRGKEFKDEFTSIVATILNKDPTNVSNKKYLINIVSTLEKVNGALKKNPRLVITTVADEGGGDNDERTAKIKFLFWFLHKLFWLKTQHIHSVDLRENLHQNCDRNVTLVLEILALKDPSMFKQVFQSILILLQGKCIVHFFGRYIEFFIFLLQILLVLPRNYAQTKNHNPVLLRCHLSDLKTRRRTIYFAPKIVPLCLEARVTLSGLSVIY